MRKRLITICFLLCGLLSSYAASSPDHQPEQIIMSYEEPLSQGSHPRTMLPMVSAEISNHVVSVYITHYTGYVSTYVTDSNGNIICSMIDYATDGQCNMNGMVNTISHDTYTIRVVLDFGSYVGSFEL